MKKEKSNCVVCYVCSKSSKTCKGYKKQGKECFYLLEGKFCMNMEELHQQLLAHVRRILKVDKGER